MSTTERPTRQPNESHEQFRLRISIPTIKERVSVASRLLTLIAAASTPDRGEEPTSEDIIEAIHAAALDAIGELYYVSVTAGTDAMMAPDGDQERDLEREAARAAINPDPRD